MRGSSLADGTGRRNGHDAGSQIYADYNFTYDLASRMTSFAYSANNGQYADVGNFTYDDNDQLTLADWQTKTDEVFNYDQNGNRDLPGYDTDTNNQLASDGVYTYKCNGPRKLDQWIVV